MTSPIESGHDTLSIADARLRTRNVIAAWQAVEGFVSRCDCWMRGYDLTFSRELASNGLLGLTWPKEYGGAGLTAGTRLAVTEELLRAGAPVAAHWIGERQIGPAILRYGSDRMKAEILPGIASADITFCLGMSETEAGSDLAAVRTRAVPVEGGWLISGSKMWTTQAHRCSHMYVLARTGSSESKHEGLTEFVVEMSDPRITVRPIYDLVGEHHFNEVILDGVTVPEHQIIGQVGNGWTQVTEQLSFERGGAERFLSTYPLLASLFACIRRVPDRACTEKVGSLIARLAALRHMAWKIAAEFDAGQPPIAAAAKLKYLGTNFEKDVVDIARYVVEVTDGSARTRELLAEAMLCVPGGSLRGGVSEVLLTLIARAEIKK